MGIINKLTKRCIFCGNKGGAIYVPDYGIYSETCAGNYYHPKCLKEIMCEPEKYKTRVVDMAIDIVDRIKSTKEKEERRKKREARRCEYLKSHCID